MRMYSSWILTPVESMAETFDCPAGSVTRVREEVGCVCSWSKNALAQLCCPLVTRRSGLMRNTIGHPTSSWLETPSDLLWLSLTVVIKCYILA
jgi:hypothetical protein